MENFANLLAEKSCRICGSGESQDKPLRYPCLCKGSMKYVHEDW